MTRCPKHWRGHHRFVVPGTNMQAGHRPFGATAGVMVQTVCSRCGESYASASLDGRDVLAEVRAEIAAEDAARLEGKQE